MNFIPVSSGSEGLSLRHRKRKFKKRLARFVLVGFALCLILFFSFNAVYKSFSGTSNPLLSAQAAPETENPLKAAVESSLKDTKGTYSVVIKDLKSQEQFSKDQDRVFEAGSLYKLWVMATAFKQIEEGTLGEGEILNADIKDLNAKFAIDPNDAELTEGKLTVRVSDALTQMITISHNYNAMILTDRVKLSNVTKFLEDYGFKESKVGTQKGPVTTAAEIAMFFEKLYKGELAGKESTEKMLELLKNQKLNDKLPKLLPKEIKLAHKTGELSWFSHDGGIVYSPSGDYTIVVLSETELPAAAEERIAEISKKVYDYFNRNVEANGQSGG